MKKPRLSRRQVRAAAEKWPAKDTATIALELCVSEAAVWNSLDRIKSISAEFLPVPPNPLNNAIGGAANIYPLTVRPSAARRLSDPVEIAHREGSPLSVASTLRRELENCPSTRETENLREGM